MNLPKEIDNFIDEFSKLPSVGPRMATRMAFYLTESNNNADELSRSFSNLSKINRCPKCFFVKEENDEICSICSNKNRNDDLLVIVEKDTDLLSVENSKVFNGFYFIVGSSNNRGTLSDIQKKRLDYLKKRIKKENLKIKELIIAVDFNTFGDFLFHKIKDDISFLVGKVTRLGRGMPTGSEVEFADSDTLAQSFESRK